LLCLEISGTRAVHCACGSQIEARTPYFIAKRLLTMTQNTSAAKKRVTPFSVVLALAGVCLFAYFVERAGVRQIAKGIVNLGAGFLIIIAISAVRQFARSLAWMLSMEAPNRLRFWDALRARVMGDALGNILPFANFFVSEPLKPVLIRDRVPLDAGFSAIAIENIFYGLSVGLFIASGMVALLLSVSVPKGLRLISIVTIVVVAVVIAFGTLLFSKQLRFISGATSFLHRHGLDAKWVENGRILEDRIYGFYQHNRSRFLPILLLEGCFHLAGVCEVYVTLSFISPQQMPTLLTAFILESVNRVISVVFKFIPLRMGVDEAGTGRVSKALLFTEATGVTLAIIRKGRDVFWAALGMALLFQRGLSVRAVTQVDAGLGEPNEGAAMLAKEPGLTLPKCQEERA
jgi:hypothetical protein